MVERVPRSGRKLLPPQAVDERVDVDQPAVPEREHRQQRLTLRAAHVRGRPAREDLERAENPDLQQLLHTRLAPPPPSLARSSALASNARQLALVWHRPGARSPAT